MNVLKSIFSALLLLSCSEGGDITIPSVITKVENQGKLAYTPQNLTGSINIEDIGESQFEIWIYDHTSPSLERVPISTDGTFKLPLTLFYNERIYSFHIVNNFKWLATLAFGTNDSPSEYLKYQGGDGFDLGKIQVPLDSFGLPQVGQQLLLQALGGGFSIVASQTHSSFLSFPDFLGISQFSFGPSLRIKSPINMYYSYILSEANPELYKSSLNHSTHLILSVKTIETGQYQNVSLADADPSVLKSSLLTEDFEPNSDFWKLSSFALDVNDGAFSKRFYVGKIPPFLSSVVLRLLPKSGSIKFLPLTLQDTIVMPPVVLGIAYNGLTPNTKIDFTDSNIANGLTSPFCINSNMRIRIAYPKIGTKRKINPVDTLNLEITYLMQLPYETKDLIPDPADFPSGFREERTLNTESKWMPQKRILTYNLTNNANDFVDIDLPAEIFLTSIRGKQVIEHRLEAVFNSTTTALDTSSVTRYTHHCGSL